MDNKNEVIENQNNKTKSNNCFFVGGDDWIENKEESIKKEGKEKYKSKIKLF